MDIVKGCNVVMEYCENNRHIVRMNKFFSIIHVGTGLLGEPETPCMPAYGMPFVTKISPLKLKDSFKT